jgi:hypothetical protein
MRQNKNKKHTASSQLVEFALNHRDFAGKQPFLEFGYSLFKMHEHALHWSLLGTA